MKRPPPLRSDEYKRVGKAVKNGNHILLTINGKDYIFNIRMAYALLNGNYDEVYIYEEDKIKVQTALQILRNNR